MSAMSSRFVSAAARSVLLVAAIALAGCTGGVRGWRGCCDPCAGCCPCDPWCDPCCDPRGPAAAPAVASPKEPRPLAIESEKPAAPPAPAVAEAPAAPPAVVPSPAAPAAPAKEPGVKRLVERLGGEAGVTAIVDGFLRQIATDHRVMSNPLVKQRLKKVNVAALRQHIIDQLCEGCGGPNRYTGRDMKSSHVGLGISAAEWRAGIEDLVATMDGLGIPDKEQRELLAIIRPMKQQVVEIW